MSERRTKISLQSGASLYANARVESPRLESVSIGFKSCKIRRNVIKWGALARNEELVSFNQSSIRDETETKKEKRHGVVAEETSEPVIMLAFRTCEGRQL